jgi:hypothetical protein
MWDSLAHSNHTCHANDLFHHYISYHTICQESPEQPNGWQGKITWTTLNSKSLHIRAKSTSTTLPQVSLRPLEKKHCWENRTALNFRTNYQRVANTFRLARDLNGARAQKGDFCRVCFLFSHILLTEVFAGRVSEDNDKDDNNNDNKEENNAKDTDDEDEDDHSNKDNKNEYDKNRSINNNNKDNIMPPKLKPASLSPTKATKKEPRVEKLTSAISKKLKITTLPFKPYSMKTLDGYMVKPYTQKFVDYVEVDIHVAGPLPEHAYKAELSEEFDMEEGNPGVFL